MKEHVERTFTAYNIYVLFLFVLFRRGLLDLSTYQTISQTKMGHSVTYALVQSSLSESSA